MGYLSVSKRDKEKKRKKCVKFTLPNVKHMVTDITVRCKKLNLVDNVVFLGITLDAQ